MNNFVATLKQLGPVRLGIMGAILASLLVFFAFVSAHISSPGSMRAAVSSGESSRRPGPRATRPCRPSRGSPRAV